MSTSPDSLEYATITHMKNLDFSFSRYSSGGIQVKPGEAKQEYQLQVWSGMIQQQKASGLNVKNWCIENGVSENAYYYRLRKIRQAACSALEQMQEATLTEVPVAPKTDFETQIRITMKAATVEVSHAGPDVLDHILRTLSHVE